MAYWWVNQGQSYAAQRAGQFIWAPLVDARGAHLPDWDSVDDVRPGDTIIHYANGTVRALSTAVSLPTVAPKPVALPSTWGSPGRMIRVAMTDAVPPIPRNSIPLAERLAQVGGPFDRNGNLKQSYLWPISEAFGRNFVDQFSSSVPAVIDEGAAADDGALPQDPALRKKVELYAVEVVADALRVQHGGAAVDIKPPNHKGYDIGVERPGAPDLCVEVKGTMRTSPVFQMSEVERQLSVDEAARYELHVVWGIDPYAKTHKGVAVRLGAVTEATHGLVIRHWQGRI